MFDGVPFLGESIILFQVKMRPRYHKWKRGRVLFDGHYPLSIYRSPVGSICQLNEYDVSGGGIREVQSRMYTYD